MSEYVKIQPLRLLINEKPIHAEQPSIEMVDPQEVYIDFDYQRRHGRRSIKLAEKIARGWDYRKYNLPHLVREPDGRLLAVDGQTTLIGAASNPYIGKIPCLVFTNLDTKQSQAQTFVSLNLDRVTVTTNQVFKAKLAAKDAEAMAVEAYAKSRGINLVYEYTVADPQPGDLIAILTLVKLYNSRTENQLSMLLDILVEAEVCPIGQMYLLAVDELLWNSKENYAPYDIVTALRTTLVEGGKGFASRKRKDAVALLKDTINGKA